MNYYDLFISYGEPFAAGLFEFNDKSQLYRYSNAYKRFWENAVLTPYDGGELYPCGHNIRRSLYNSSIAIVPDYSYTCVCNWGLLSQKNLECYNIFYDEWHKVSDIDTVHVVGGAGYTHCFPNYERILKEGLNGYRKRIEALSDQEFKESMLLMLDGIEMYRIRCIELLKNSNANQCLIDALEYVPNNTPRNIYEAIVAWNFIYYVDGCDDIGSLDRGLHPYYNGENVVELLKELFSHVDVNDGWSGALGPDYNELTVQCITAIKNCRRPNLQLLVKDNMPDYIWDAVKNSLMTSCGQPALYNYAFYYKKLKEIRSDISEEDLKKLAFGGCTETMLEGLSNVGSADAGINLTFIFDRYLRDHFKYHETFESFKEGLLLEIRNTIVDVLKKVNNYRKTRALYRPQPVHTLFVDDCIEKCKDFNDGGARYYWSVINVAGMINVVDSLPVIKTLVYDDKIYSPEEFIEKMDNRDQMFLKMAEKCHHYGSDDDLADSIAFDFAKKVYSCFDIVDCYPSGKFYPGSLQFTTYADAGKNIGATPDGRDCGDPLCDSMGAIHGHDIAGPTAMLSSVAKMPLNMVVGTPITNIRLSKDHLPSILKSLVLGFFKKGGIQLQISCLSRDEIIDAINYPENHKNLVVRIGGFSEFFIRLSPELQKTVLERTEY